MGGSSMAAWMNAWEGDLSPSPAAERSAARINARTRSTRYYGKEATARIPEPLPENERTDAIPVLKVVTRHRPRWGVVLAVLAFSLLIVGAGIVAPVMISSATTGVESAVGQMEVQQQELTAANAALSAQISSLASPQRVAEQAAQMGLVPADDIHYLAVGSSVAATEGDTTVAGR